MCTRLKSREALLFLAFALMFSVAALVSGFAPEANALEAGSSTAPTIQSDKADYPPGATVTLRGSGWQPGESVHINVNDEAGRTWSRDVDVSADESGNITDQFDLPNWFVATYSVTATGAQSGVVTTSFTDADVHLEGQSKPVCVPKNANDSQCLTGGWEAGNLSGWKELDEIPLRLRFDTTGSKTVHVDFDHVLTSDSTKTGIQNLYGWTAGSGVSFNGATLTSSSGAVWTYTVNVNVTQAGGILNFKGNLSAGAHNFTGSSLAVGADLGAGTLQIQKPGAAPGSPDLAVTKSGPTSAAPGSTITYTLNYQNKATAASSATGAQLTDILPSGVTYVSGSCSGTCSVAGNEVVWNLGTLAKGDSGSRTVQVQIPSNAAFGANYTDTGRILSAENDANANDNLSNLTTTVSFNRNPVANNDSLTTSEDNAGNVDVLSNDTDPDVGDTPSVTNKTNGSNGTVNCTTDGVCTYTPNANFNGTDSFTYTVSEGKGGTATGTVNVTVNAVNDTPSFTKGADQTVNEDSGAQTVNNWATNISRGPSDESGQAVDFVITNNSNSLLFSSGPSVSPSGALSYTPAANKNGTATITLKINDDGGTANGGVDESAAQSFTITVNAVNDDPVANDDSAAIDEDTNAGIDVLANDSDIDGGSLDVTSFSQPSNGTVSKDPDGKLSYVPNNDFNGTDSFTYSVSDGKGGTAAATVKVTVNPVNDVPNATADAYEVNEDELLTVAATDGILKNDSDVENSALTAVKVSEPAKGTLTLNSNGSFTYTPNEDFNGTDSFTYKADDGTADSNVATVTITVKAVNDAPVAQDEAATTDEDKAIASIPVLTNDTDVDGDSLSVSTFDHTSAQGGTVSQNNADGTLRYEPAAHFNGTDSFAYTISDGKGGTATANVTITVEAVNDAPTFEKGEDQTVDEDAGAQTVTNWAGAISAGHNESSQNVTFIVTNSNNSLFSAQPAIAPDGTLSYTPAADDNGSAAVTVKINDDGGTPNDPSDDLASAEQTFTITVRPINDAPSFEIGANQTADEDAGAQEVANFAKEISKGPDNESSQSVEFIRTTNTNPALFSAEPEISADGTLTYAPAADAYGEATVGFLIKDSGGTEIGGVDTSATQSFKITVTAVNDDPVIESVSAVNDPVDEGSPATITVTATDVDDQASALSYSFDCDNSVANGYEKGPQSADNATCTFDDGTQTYQVNVRVADGAGGSATASTNVDVNNVAPTAKLVNNGPIAENSAATISFTDQNDPSNADSSALRYAYHCNGADFSPTPSYADLAASASQRCSFDDDGEYSVQALIMDKDGAFNVYTTEVTVNNVAPTAKDLTGADGQVTTPEDTPKEITLEATNPGNDQLTFKVVDGPQNGTLSGGGTNLTYTPDKDFNGSDSFTFEVCDDDQPQECDQGTVEILVTSVNDASVAKDDSVQTSEETPTPITLSATDLENDTLNYRITSLPSNGKLYAGAVDPTNQIVQGDPLGGAQLTYVPGKDFNGPDSFGFLANDGADDSNEATVSITVTPVNDAPVLDLNGSEGGLDYSTTFTEDAGEVGIVGTSGAAALSVTDVDDEDMESATAELINRPDGADEALTVNTGGTPSIQVTGYDSSTGVLSLSGQASKAEYEQALRTVKYNNTSQNPSTEERKVEFVVNDGDLDSSRPNSTVAVISINDAPVAEDQIDDKAVTTPEDTPKEITLSASDPDSGSLGFKITTLPKHGKLYAGAVAPANEIAQGDPLGGAQLTYVPGKDFNGPDSFGFLANDGADDSNEATVSITVTPINDDPVGTNDKAETPENTPLVFQQGDLTANDAAGPNNESAQSLTITDVSGGQHGTAELDPQTGEITFTPEAGYNGTEASFLYTVCDNGQPQQCSVDKVTVNVTVTEVNDPPVANEDSATLSEDTFAIIDVKANDEPGPDNESAQSLDVDSVTNPSNGTAEVIASGTRAGQIRYVPQANYHGPDTFTYQVCDDGTTNGQNDRKCATGTVNVTVEAANDDPVAEDDDASTDEDTAIASIDVLTNDADDDGDALGVSSFETITAEGGTVSANNNGTLRYEPKANYHGPDSFTYKVNDGFADSNVATVRITVASVNDVPKANDDPYKVGEYGTLQAQAADGVLNNDADADGDSFTAALLSGPANGQLTLNDDGSFTYTPKAGFIGPDSFTYMANDGKSDSNAATVRITVDPVDCTAQGVIMGTAGADILRGTPGNDVICAFGGNDRIYAGEGNDLLIGSNGEDRLWGEGGDDVMRGGRGNDVMDAALGNDHLVGDAGRDIMMGRSGDDFVNVQDGSSGDAANGGAGTDTCLKDPGDDTVSCER